jgi:hypothetical protein
LGVITCLLLSIYYDWKGFQNACVCEEVVV